MSYRRRQAGQFPDVVLDGKPFCMQPWNSSACQAGFFYNKTEGKAQPCPEGFYCPVDKLCIIPCPKGAYCIRDRLVEAKTSSPPICREAKKCCHPSNSPPVFDPRMSRLQCPGPKSAVPCPEGNYCPNVTTMIMCPKGSFCRAGSLEPQKCPLISVCKRGAAAPVSAGAGVLFIFILFLLFVAILYYFRRRQQIHTLALQFGRRFVPSIRERYRNTHTVQAGLMDVVEQVASVDVDGDERITPKLSTVDLLFRDLSLTLKQTGKQVLQSVTGEIRAGEVTAIMGPSGAGKTTLLNTLSGKAYYGKRHGQIMVNGVEVDGLESFRTITGFVPQEDIMHRSLTVLEVLRYQATLRLPSNMTSHEKQQRVDQMIELFGLEKIKHIQIGDEESRGISGGQRKRVNIGMELVADPTLLFLDEPTSGLDSTSSLLVLDALRAVAEKGKLTVICVIHQPRFEIFDRMHKVLFLGPGGRTVFQGTVDESMAYFSSLNLRMPANVNPADFFMDVIGGLYDGKDADKNFTSAKLFDEWENHVGGKTAGSSASPDHRVMPAIVTDHHRKLPGFFSQFFCFLSREIRLQFRLTKTLLMDQFLVLLAGGTLGALRREAPLDQFFVLQTLSSLAIGLTAMLSALRCFGNTRTTFWRESSTGINRLSYFLAVNVVQLPILVVTPMMYLSLLYPLVAPRGFLMYHYIATLAAQFACTGMGYAISTLFNPKNSQMASVTFALISSLVSGLSPSLCKMQDYTVIGPMMYTLSYCRWYVEALFEKEAIRFPDVLGQYVHELANKNGYSLDNYATCIMAMMVMGLVYRVLAFLFLVFTNRGKQQ
ncbi:putative white-brown complex homolog protein 30 [Nematostella vectensis]|uniref:putative white-brown complex homolog protein 30 n=1 Tax=Nematostella vectensis TaxID=45351 RepID=UPI0020773722|nr:putative white-brown complex homolog protein 30 [Nematostella vectensis]